MEEELLSGGEALVCVQRLAESGRVNPSAPESPSPEPEEVLKEDRRIVHAGGYITSPAGKGRTYTNSAEALVNAYRAGNRVVELDFMWTSDGYLAGTHDWLSAVSPAIADGVPLSLAEWLETEVYEEFTPLCLESLAGFMREHPDLYVVTDVKVRNADAAAVIAKTCPDLKERFLIQIYQDGEYDPVAALGFPHIIYTLYNLPPEDKRDTEHLAAFAAEHPLLGYTYPDALRDVWRYTARMKNTGVLLFVHTINDREEIAACYTEGITAVNTCYNVLERCLEPGKTPKRQGTPAGFRGFSRNPSGFLWKTAGRKRFPPRGAPPWAKRGSRRAPSPPPPEAERVFGPPENKRR